MKRNELLPSSSFMKRAVDINFTGQSLHFSVLLFNFNLETDIGADVLDLAETMVASADGLVYEPVSLLHFV